MPNSKMYDRYLKRVAEEIFECGLNHTDDAVGIENLCGQFLIDVKPYIENELKVYREESSHA